MTAAAQAVPRHALPADEHDSPLTGFGTLLRLNLRRDRVRLPVWVVAVGVTVWASVVALEEAYPTAETLATRAALLENPATIMMTGPAFAVDDYTFGAAVANELSLYVFLAVAIMSILLTVRHTRAEEEDGRLEMIRALPVGRFSPATAAVATVGLANLLVGAATSVGLIAADMAVADSIAFGAATALTGLVFSALTSVLAQLSEHARGVTGMAMGVMAAAFLVRGLGDVINPTGSWLSWLSPFAWAQQTRFWVDLRWWPLLVCLAVAAGLYAAAVSLARRRDLGAGLRPPRPGPARARPALLSPTGLAERLLRGGLLAWGLGVFLFAVAMGALANELDAMLEANPALAEWIALEGTDLTAEFAGLILAYVMLAPAILAVSGVLRLKAEEESGRTEQALVTGRSRVVWLGGWLTTVAWQAVVLALVGGLGVGVGVAAGTGEGHWIGEMLVAALVFLPAIGLMMAVAVATYGVLPRVTGLAWLLVTWVSVALFLGELLRIPGWAMNLSPFVHTPLLPARALQSAPLLAMGAIAVALVSAGLEGFRRRDLATR